VLLHLPTAQQDARTESELEKATAQTRSTLQRVLKELMAAGIVRQSGSGKRGDPHRYCAILKERGNLIV
jgi:predicted transcriptional regulator